MLRPTTEQQLRESIPRYVESAVQYADRIINHALQAPRTDIRLCAWRVGRIGAMTTQTEVKELWQQRTEAWPPEVEFKADIPIESVRLALRRQEHSVAAWTYAAPEDPNDMDDLLLCGEHPHYLRSLFLEFFEEAPDNDGAHIRSAVYIDPLPKKLRTKERHDIGNLTKKHYLIATRPQLGAYDRRSLQQFGVHAFHAAKIEGILQLMQFCTPPQAGSTSQSPL